MANLTSAFNNGVLLARMIDNKRKGLINPDALDTSKGVENVSTTRWRS